MQRHTAALTTQRPLASATVKPQHTLGRQRHMTLAAPAQLRVVATRVAAADREAGPAPPVLPLSLFVPYKSLPPDGQVIPPEEEACDVAVQKCKTQAYVWETPCPSCDGTGHARAPHRSRRASLHTCIVCVGMGHVRRTTSRLPLVVPLEHAAGRALTLARTQRLPGELAAAAAAAHSQQQHSPLADQAPARRPRSSGLLKKAKELHEQQQQQQQQRGAAKQNNIVSTAGLGAAKKPQSSGTAV